MNGARFGGSIATPLQTVKFRDLLALRQRTVDRHCANGWIPLCSFAFYPEAACLRLEAGGTAALRHSFHLADYLSEARSHLGNRSGNWPMEATCGRRMIRNRAHRKNSQGNPLVS